MRSPIRTAPSLSRRLPPIAASLLVALLLGAVGCGEETQAPTGPLSTDAVSAEGTAAATTLTFLQVSGGDVHTCGLTTDQRAFCWGDNGEGRLGTGSDSGPETCTGPAGPFDCSTIPAAVVGTHPYRQISSGRNHTCAVTTADRLFCWGANYLGQLGDGTRMHRAQPVAIGGSLRFRQVSAGLDYTCAVTTPGARVYCWGTNTQGQLGDQTRSQHSLPAPVVGNLKFKQVTTGNSHSCAVTPENKAYCWGFDMDGQLGNDPLHTRRTKPVPVAGGHVFSQIEAGANHTCAVNTSKRAYCWGRAGTIGDGQSVDRFVPVAVAGGLSIERVTAGNAHTCGETTNNRAYCWGNNARGQLGDGTTAPDRTTPVAVAGGLAFTQLSAGSVHTCGKTSAGVAYCWGYDFFGQLGHGESGLGAESRAPVAVSPAS